MQLQVKDLKSFILAGRVHVIKSGKWNKKKNKNKKHLDRGLNIVTYYKYDKKCYYANIYLNLSKKIAVILVTSALIIEANKKAKLALLLKYILCI